MSNTALVALVVAPVSLAGLIFVWRSTAHHAKAWQVSMALIALLAIVAMLVMYRADLQPTAAVPTAVAKLAPSGSAEPAPTPAQVKPGPARAGPPKTKRRAARAR